MKSGLKEFVGQIKTIQVRIQGQVWISYWKWDQTSKRVSRSQRYPVTNRPAQTVRRHKRDRGLAARSKAVRLSRPFRRVDAVVVSSWGAHRKCSSGESASAPTHRGGQHSEHSATRAELPHRCNIDQQHREGLQSASQDLELLQQNTNMCISTPAWTFIHTWCLPEDTWSTESEADWQKLHLPLKSAKHCQCT